MRFDLRDMGLIGKEAKFLLVKSSISRQFVTLTTKMCKSMYCSMKTLLKNQKWRFLEYSRRWAFQRSIFPWLWENCRIILKKDTFGTRDKNRSLARFDRYLSDFNLPIRHSTTVEEIKKLYKWCAQI